MDAYGRKISPIAYNKPRIIDHRSSALENWPTSLTRNSGPPKKQCFFNHQKLVQNFRTWNVHTFGRCTKSLPFRSMFFTHGISYLSYFFVTAAGLFASSSDSSSASAACEAEILYQPVFKGLASSTWKPSGLNWQRFSRWNVLKAILVTSHKSAISCLAWPRLTFLIRLHVLVRIALVLFGSKVVGHRDVEVRNLQQHSMAGNFKFNIQITWLCRFLLKHPKK